MAKKRSPGEGALYFDKSKNLWRGVIDVGYSPEGKRLQKAVTSKSQAEARRKLNAIKDQMAQYGEVVDSSLTVEKWANHWLETVCRENMKPKPFITYQSIVKTWIVPVIGRKRINSLRPSDIRAVHRAVIDAGRSTSTALKAHVVMSSMLESARLDRRTLRNVAQDVKPPKAAVSTRSALETSAAIQLLATAAQQFDGVQWWLALLAGLRQGERLGATIDSVDFVNHRFTVQWSLTEAKYEDRSADKLLIAPGLDYRRLQGRICLVRPKSGKVRSFPLIPQLEEALRRYLEASAHIPNPHGLLFRNSDGSPLNAKQDNLAWRELLFDAGLITEEQNRAPKDRPEGTPTVPTTHWGRHTTASVLMELGVPQKVIGEIVGHVSESTTQNYQHVTDQAALAAMQKIGEHFAKALEPGGK